MSKNAGKYIPLQLEDGIGYISYDIYLQKPFLLELREMNISIKFDDGIGLNMPLSNSDVEAEQNFDNFIKLYHQIEDIPMCPIKLEHSFLDENKEKYRYVPIRTKYGIVYISFEDLIQKAINFVLNNRELTFDTKWKVTIELSNDFDIAKERFLNFMEIYHYMKGLTMLPEKHSDIVLPFKKDKNMMIPLKTNTGMCYLEISMLKKLRRFSLEKDEKDPIKWMLFLFDKDKNALTYVLSKDESDAKETYNNFVGWFHFINGIEIMPLFVSKKEETPKDLPKGNLPVESIPEDLIDVLPNEHPNKRAYLQCKDGHRGYACMSLTTTNFALAGACEGGRYNLAIDYIQGGANDFDLGLQYAFRGGDSDMINLMINKGGKINTLNKPYIKYYINQHLKSGKFVPEKLPNNVKNIILECLQNT